MKKFAVAAAGAVSLLQAAYSDVCAVDSFGNQIGCYSTVDECRAAAPAGGGCAVSDTSQRLDFGAADPFGSFLSGQRLARSNSQVSGQSQATPAYPLGLRTGNWEFTFARSRDGEVVFENSNQTCFGEIEKQIQLTDLIAQFSNSLECKVVAIGGKPKNADFMVGGCKHDYALSGAYNAKVSGRTEVNVSGHMVFQNEGELPFVSEDRFTIKRVSRRCE